MWVWMNDMRLYERGLKRTAIQSNIVLQRVFQYLDTWEFVNELEVEEDFHINHSICNMHIWLLYQRLRVFSKNKFAYDLRESLVDSLNSYTQKEIMGIDVMRKNKKLEDIENYLFAIRKSFDFHFLMNGKTSENNYYKIDALVWSCIYHEKVPRYSEKVFKMAEYMIQQFKYVNTLSYEDIEKARIDWNAYRVPPNYKDKVLKYNIPLTQDEFQNE